MPVTPTREPSAATLRHRAGTLRGFADALERAAVFDLDPTTYPPDADQVTPRLALGRRMVATNLQQLLAAAEELRDIAWQLETRARHLDGRPRGPHGASAA